MIQIRMTLPGLDDLRKAFEQAKEETKKKVKDAVTRTTLRVHAAAKKRIQQGPKTGEIVRKYTPNREHQQSQRGEAPATDTGALANSIFWKVDETGGYVFSNLEYAPILEFSLERPFLFPSLEENAPEFRRELEEILK
jgi:hypothetical protein